MDLTFLLILLVVLMVAVAILVVFLTVGSGKGAEGGRQQAAVSDALRSLVAAQRQTQASDSKSAAKNNLALAAAAESDDARKSGYRNAFTLERRLKYAKWTITPIQFRAIQIVATISGFIFCYMYFGWILRLLELFLVPSLISNILDYSINRRFKAFDKDYPVLLMQYVSLLKTGMSAIAGLETAAKGLEPISLVRAEIELLIERLRLGLNEEQALSAFGENIAHPELELFVQSLILSRRVGGTLSSTLERLARQVRKRQQFREQALAAVGMERGSIYAIACIMSFLLLYMLFTQPDLLKPAFTDPKGQGVLQAGVGLIILGFYWSKQVTKIRV